MQHLVAIPAFVSFYNHVVDAGTEQKPFVMAQSHNLLQSLSAISTRFRACQSIDLDFFVEFTERDRNASRRAKNWSRRGLKIVLLQVTAAIHNWFQKLKLVDWLNKEPNQV